MKQDNKPKNPAAGATISEQNTVSEQIAAAKLKQRESARARAAGVHPRKSMSAAEDTPQQSEVTQKPPQLYQVERINIPADFAEVARLIFRELTKVQQSQSVILNLWQKLRGQVAGMDSIDFTVPVNFTAGAEIGGVSLTNWRFGGTYEWNSVPWNVDTGLYIERNETETSSMMIIHFYGGNGDSCPAMQFRVDYKTGGLYYRSARDGYGFEVDFVELATQTALENMRTTLKAEIYAELRAAGFDVPE